jgi:hypothetical protein
LGADDLIFTHNLRADEAARAALLDGGIAERSLSRSAS